MASRPCAAGGCGMAKSADVHSRHYKGADGHPFVLDGKYGLGMSEGYKNRLTTRRTFTRPMYEQECVVKVRGGFTVPDCSGIATVHEPWTRGRGGPIDDPRNMVPMCAFHNTWVSQDVEGQRWAEANDLLIHAWQGPTWLSLGGVNAPAGGRQMLHDSNVQVWDEEHTHGPAADALFDELAKRSAPVEAAHPPPGKRSRLR